MTNINQEIADLKAKLAEIEKKVAGDAEPNGFKIDQTYFAIETTGRVTRYTYRDDELDICYVAQGNAFHTEAEAVHERDKRALLQEMKVFRKGSRFDPSQFNWTINYSTLDEMYVPSLNTTLDCMPLSGWFASEDEAERAIAHFGDRLNLLREV